MISKQELRYVSSDASNVPYPGNAYAYEALNKLGRALTAFQKKYDGKIYNILLSNGEEVCFEIKNKNLAHLLGIDYKTISNNEELRPLLYSVLGFDDKNQINSYNVLKRIIDNGDRVIDNDELSFNKLLNYYRIMVKASSFELLSEFNEFNFGIIEFDKRIYDKYITKDFSPTASRYLFSESNESLAPYCMMGLAYDKSNIDVMIPETILLPPNFSDYLYRQELAVPVQVLINDDINLSKLVATNEEKIKILNLYKFLIQKYDTDSYINIFNDYETILYNDMKKKKVIE